MPTRRILITAMTVAALAGLSVHAQNPSPSTGTPLYPGLDPALLQQLQPPSIVPPFSLRATPESPSPGETVKIEALPSVFETRTADYRWTINGSPRNDASGIGRTIFTTAAGRVGSVIRIQVNAREPDGTSHTAQLSIHVSDLAVEWTAHTYIPKWYKGKALPILGSFVTISAIPSFMLDGSFIPPSRLIYTWLVDGREALKGAGEQTLTTRYPSFPRTSRTVIIRVQDIEQRIRKEVRLGLVPQAPRAAVYRTTPLGGIEPRQSVTLIPDPEDIIDVQAEPFYFNTSLRSNLDFQWRINGVPQPAGAPNPSHLTISTAGATNSLVSVSALIRHPGQFTSSSASKSLILLFSDSNRLSGQEQ
jgi:hypothetical protein